MAFHTLCVGFIKVLGHWSEVGAVRRVVEPQFSTMWLSECSPFRGMWPSQPRPDAGVVGRLSRVPGVSFAQPVFFQILLTMARRPRSSRAWHFVLSAAHRDADARAMALAGTANWGYDSDGQVGGYCWTKVPRTWRQVSPYRPQEAPRTEDRRTLLLTLGLPWLRIHMVGPQDRYPILLSTLCTEEGGSWFFDWFIPQNISIPLPLTSL